jgi:hypothetical protein
MKTVTTVLLVLALSSMGMLLMAESAQARPPIPCLVGQSYYDGCLICKAPDPNAYCACRPECPPPPEGSA